MSTEKCPTPCSAEGCPRVAVTWLQFRQQPGHVHVCGPCEALDREWCDVTASGQMPCATCTDDPIYTAQPALLEDAIQEAES